MNSITLPCPLASVQALYKLRTDGQFPAASSSGFLRMATTLFPKAFSSTSRGFLRSLAGSYIYMSISFFLLIFSN